MTDTSQLVAYLAPGEAVARRAAEALEKEGIACALRPAVGYHGLEPGRVEVWVSAEHAPRARVLALEAVAP